MIDRTAFNSDRLPTEHFDRRFSEDNLVFWVPLLVAAGRITPSTTVLDVGCGTGGFSREVAATTGAAVTGLDASAKFLAYARRQRRPPVGSVRWISGRAEALPFDDDAFDCVLLSLVLHQLSRPVDAVTEASRVLRRGGTVVVRTIRPEDVAERVPVRYIPAMAGADAARMLRITDIEEWIASAGLVVEAIACHTRNKVLSLEDEERALLAEVRGRFPFVGPDELAKGLRRMRIDAAAASPDWIDPRPTYVISARKPSG